MSHHCEGVSANVPKTALRLEYNGAGDAGATSLHGISVAAAVALFHVVPGRAGN